MTIRFFSATLLAIVIEAGIGCRREVVTKPTAQGGVLDLQNYDFARQGVVALDGQWEFYYGQFIAPQKFHERLAPKGMFLPVPDSWNHHTLDGKKMRADHYATYRLRIRLPIKVQPDFPLSLRLDTAGTAYTLFVNGSPLVSAGQPATSPAESRGSYKVITVPMRAVRSEIELIFHISNYLHRSGGLWFSHHLGTVEQINRMREKGLFADAILLGALFIIGFYHLALFFNRRQERPVLHFGLFCLMVAFRVPFTGEFFLTQLFPDFPLSLQLRLEYTTVYITPVFIISFIAYSYAERTRKFIIYFSRIVALLFFVSVLLFPPLVFTQFILYHDIYLVFIVIWTLSTMAIAVRQRERNALISLLLILLLGATLTNDLLFSMEYIYTTSMLPFGLIVFVFVQAVLLSRQFYHAYRLSENLSATLTVTNRDLTQLKESLEHKVAERTEVLEEKNRELAVAINTRERFLSIMAHDLRSPLLGMARIFEAATTGVMQIEKQMVPVLARTVRESVNLLENMLNWALSQKNQLKIFPDDIQVLPMAEKIAGLFEHIVTEKDICFSLVVPSALWVHADRSMLETVLRNLLANAMKFTPRGGEISLAAFSRGDSVRFEVSDNGTGIGASRLAHLFTSADFVAKSTVPATNEGTGLGLIICKEFVETNGGTIGAESAEGQGSLFWFELPFGVNPGRRAEVDVSAAESHLSQLKTLVVEDNAIHLRLVEAVLAELGISAEMVGDGGSAWQLLEKQKFDFVLLDGNLPVIDGFALAERISKLNPRPVVIFHSSFSEQEIVGRVSPEHFDAILPKPLGKDALLRVLLEINRFSGGQEKAPI